MLRKKLTFKYDKLKKKPNRFYSLFMKTRLNLISVKYVGTYKQLHVKKELLRLFEWQR